MGPFSEIPCGTGVLKPKKSVRQIKTSKSSLFQGNLFFLENKSFCLLRNTTPPLLLVILVRKTIFQ